MSTTPKVSIIMPVFNGEKFLKETLESIQAQTFRNYEVVLIDDGSTDGTSVILDRIVADDPRFRLFTHPENRGVAAARWTGWHATDPASIYLMNHDCDDISYTDKLQKLVDYLDAHPKVDAVGTFAEYIDPNGNVTGAPPLESEPSRIRSTFSKVNSMINSATLFRRRMIERVDPYHSEFKLCEDYEFWAKSLLAGFTLANIPEILHKVRLHPASVSAVKAKEMEEYSHRIGRYYRRERFMNFFRRTGGGI